MAQKKLFYFKVDENITAKSRSKMVSKMIVACCTLNCLILSFFVGIFIYYNFAFTDRAHQDCINQALGLNITNPTFCN